MNTIDRIAATRPRVGVPASPTLLRPGWPPSELIQPARTAPLLGYTLIDWAVIIVTWWAMAYTPVWMYPLLILILAGRYHALGVILHDIVHQPRQEKSFGIRFIEMMTGYPIGSTVNAMRYHHLRHHRDAGLPTDPYFKPVLAQSRPFQVLMVLRSGLLAFWWTLRGLYGSLAFYIPRLRQSYAYLFLQDRSGEFVGETDEVMTCAREDRYQLLFHLVVGYLMFQYAADLALWAYVVPVFIAGMLAGNRLIKEHSLEPNTDRSFQTVWTTTNTHDTNWWGQFLTAPRNIGYHQAHHVHPQAALYHLPKLTRWYDLAMRNTLR